MLHRPIFDEREEWAIKIKNIFEKFDPTPSFFEGEARGFLKITDNLRGTTSGFMKNILNCFPIVTYSKKF